MLFLVAGIAMEIGVARSLEQEFDKALTTSARALVTLTEQEQGEVELDFADEFMPDFESSADPHYFEVWLGGDELLERSRSFSGVPDWSGAGLPRARDLAAVPRIMDTALPDGRRGRLVQIDFVPQIDDEDEPGEGDDELSSEDEPLLDPRNVEPGSALRTATVLVARERETLDTQIVRLRWLFLSLAGVLLASLTALVAVSLRVGLRPLGRLAREVRGLSADSLDRRVDMGSWPRELVPLVERFNGLVARLEAAFRRERQLTSDIAHELRTPVAELRNLCEVGARWPEDEAATRDFFQDASAIAMQMERIVVNLLALTCCDEGVETVNASRVDLASLVADAWEPLRVAAGAKGLVFENEVRPGVTLDTDREKLRLILSNLFSNAVAYSRRGTSVSCGFQAAHGGARLTVSNCPKDLDSDDLPVMFDRFWRKDQVRQGGRNLGLGLAIVRALADLLGFEVEASLVADDLLEIALFRTV